MTAEASPPVVAPPSTAGGFSLSQIAAPGSGSAEPPPLDLDDHGEDERPAAELLVDELGDVVVEILLEERDLTDLLLGGLVERLPDDVTKLVPQPIGLLGEWHPAEDHLGVRHLGAVVGRDRRDDDEHPVVRELAAVAQGELVRLPDGDSVDEDHARVNVGAE